jgi:hypothetical protein
MKRNFARAGVVIVLSAAYVVSTAAAAQAQDPACSLALTAGRWAFTSTGTVVGIGPRAVLGTFTLDASGRVLNGKGTADLNGVVDDETFSGTYSVNPDCTGELTAEVINQPVTSR